MPFVDHQHSVAVTEGLGHVGTQVITHLVGVPRRPGQQVPHPVRIPIPGMLGDRPTVLPRQLRQQPHDEPTGSPTGFHPSESATDPRPQPVRFHRPPGWLYAVTHGHSLII